MGYSEVALTLRKTDALELIRKAKGDENNAQSLIAAAQIVDHNNYVTFYWDQVRWDYTLPSVRFIDNCRDDVDEYSFKRVGEDSGDIEIDWGGDYSDICELSEVYQCIRVLDGKQLYVRDIWKDVEGEIA